MAYRIHADDGDGESVLSFHGDLDRGAFEDLARRVRERTGKGKRVRAILRTGTNVESGIVDELVRIQGVTLQAESGFLAYWIERARKQSKEE